MKKLVRKHSLATRWLHWVNFPVMVVMAWSGLLIYWANEVYRIGWGNKTILKFFPDTFNKALNIPYRLAEGMSIHFVFMWIFGINGIFYLLYLAFSGEWRKIFPGKNSMKEAWQVLLHDLGIRKGTTVKREYNAAQRIVYTVIILLGLLMLLTGFAIYKPVQLNWLCALLGGYEWARAEHFIITILFVLFFIVHVLQVIRAGWKNFSSMVTGFITEAGPEMPDASTHDKTIKNENKVAP